MESWQALVVPVRPRFHSDNPVPVESLLRSETFQASLSSSAVLSVLIFWVPTTEHQKPSPKYATAFPAHRSEALHLTGCSPSSREVRAETQGRNRRRGHGGVLLIGLLFMAYLACFLNHTSSGVVPLTPISKQENAPQACPQGSLVGAFSQLRCPLLKLLPLCQVATNVAVCTFPPPFHPVTEETQIMATNFFFFF